MSVESAEAQLPTAEATMKRCTEHLQRELAKIRTGRANPDLVESILVDYYGVLTPLNQLAQISVPEARLLLIQPYDRSQIAAMERAIQSGELGLNPANDGEVIRIPIPPLNEERRKEFVRLVKQRGEEARVAIRNVRRDTLHRFHQEEKEGDLPEDTSRRLADQLQKITDRLIGVVDQLVVAKEAELMVV